MAGPEESEAVPIPITGELDLHAFRPAEVASLLEDYFAECRRSGIRVVRVIHGKGTGALRETVHSCLRRMPGIADFRLGDEHSGGWGATLVTLKPAGPRQD
jgi:DNA-nicking Smr family endonuclease